MFLPRIAPSLLAAGLANLEKVLKDCETGGADLIHMDVMDGHFVPNLTFGLPLIEAVHQCSIIPMDVHMMVTNPDPLIESYRKFRIAMISVHVETCMNLHRTLMLIKALGAKAGVAVNPATSLSSLEAALPFVDFILVMSVNPGFSGQKPIVEESLKKIRALKNLREALDLSFSIEVDGGISEANIFQFWQAGGDTFVSGSALFSKGNIRENLSKMRRGLQKE